MDKKKKAFFAYFEETHRDDINNLEVSLKAQKEKLISENDKKAGNKPFFCNHKHALSF